MKITECSLSDLKPYENNPRINKDSISQVIKSIKNFGFRQPIVVTKELVIVAGHTRFEAAKQLGLETVPVHIIDNLTADQIKAYRIADNKSGESSFWDFSKLDIELSSLPDSLFTGFDKVSLFEDFKRRDTINNIKQDTSTGNPEILKSNLPKELEGVDLVPDSLKTIVGTEETLYQRVIITYRPDQKTALETLLGIEIKQIIYNLDDIIK